MANIITAGNSTNGGTQIVTDTSGTLDIKTGSGSGVIAMSIDASGNVSGVIKSGTAVTASGGSIDFTSIPSTVKRITVMFSEVSLAAAGTVRIRVGTSSGLVTTGYTGGIVTNTLAPAITMANLSASPEGMAGFSTTANTATITTQYIISNLSGNIWVCTGMAYRFGDGIFQNSAGGITLSGTLDRVSVVATTSSFDAGTINILYE